MRWSDGATDETTEYFKQYVHINDIQRNIYESV